MCVCVDGRVWSSSAVQISVRESFECCQRAFLAEIEGEKGHIGSTTDHNRYHGILR